jgi:hypothetical protein
VAARAARPAAFAAAVGLTAALVWQLAATEPRVEVRVVVTPQPWPSPAPAVDYGPLMRTVSGLAAANAVDGVMATVEARVEGVHAEIETDVRAERTALADRVAALETATAPRPEGSVRAATEPPRVGDPDGDPGVE